MSDTVIKVENLSKSYRLGTIGGSTLREDPERWRAKSRGRSNPSIPAACLPRTLGFFPQSHED
jgi:hypothetical protein